MALACITQMTSRKLTNFGAFEVAETDLDIIWHARGVGKIVGCNGGKCGAQRVARARDRADIELVLESVEDVIHVLIDLQ